MKCAKIFSFCLGMLFFVLPCPTATAQDISISGNYRDYKLQEVLRDIENHYPIKFFYREEWLHSDKLNLQYSQQSLPAVMDLLLKNTGLTYLNYGGDKIIIVRKDQLGNLSSNTYFLARQWTLSTDINRSLPLLIVGDSSKVGSSSLNPIRLELTDKEDGLLLDGVVVYFEQLELTFTSSNGRIDLDLTPGLYQLEARRTGYEPFICNLRVLSDGTVNIEMAQEAIELREVVVSGESPDNRLMNPQTGIVAITPKQIKEMPVFVGEADVIKTIQTLPGVTTIGEGAPGFFVRGGNIDHNLVLQDEIIFTNSSHALGFFSLFNPDLISKVQLYKGNIPAQFGGRLSSVLDVQLRGNNYTETNINGGAGTVMSKLSIETPIIKEKLSFLAGGRISYADWILPVIKIPEIQESDAFFYDLNFKLSARISDNGSVTAGYFQSFDRVNFQGEAGFEWTNKSLSINWNQGIGRTVQSEFKVAAGETSNLNFDPSGLNLTELVNGLEFYKLKENVSVPINNHVLIGGGEWIYYRPKDEVLRTMGSSQENRLRKDYGQELGFYVNDEWELNKKLALSLGVRATIFLSEERPMALEKEQRYHYLEPRISARYGVGPAGSVKASYNRMSQYIHLLSNTTGVLPIDQWILSNSTIKPSVSNNFSLGYFRNFHSNAWESSVELFYRRMADLMEFKDFAGLVLNPDIENEILQGDGKAYGMEVFLKRHTGKVKGSLSYTFSRSFVKVFQSAENVDLNWFPAKFDRPHNLNLIMDWTVNRKSRFALVFNFTSGRPITAPVTTYNLGNVVVPNYSARNEFRIPDYHRLDLAYIYKRNAVKTKKYQDSITFSIYNIYSRRNAFSLFFRKENNQPAQAFRLSVLGSAFPSITYSFEFK